MHANAALIFLAFVFDDVVFFPNRLFFCNEWRPSVCVCVYIYCMLSYAWRVARDIISLLVGSESSYERAYSRLHTHMRWAQRRLMCVCTQCHICVVLNSRCFRALLFCRCSSLSPLPSSRSRGTKWHAAAGHHRAYAKCAPVLSLGIVMHAGDARARAGQLV